MFELIVFLVGAAGLIFNSLVWNVALFTGIPQQETVLLQLIGIMTLGIGIRIMRKL